MGSVPVRARVLGRRFRSALALTTSVAITFYCSSASAERLSFRSYGATDGLTNLSGACTTLAGPGYLLICSEHGVFFYDGRVFHNLGQAQGLPEGGFADGIALARNGRVAVRYPNRLFVSDRPMSVDHSPDSLVFKPIDLGSAEMFGGATQQIVPYGNGLAVITGQGIKYIGFGADGQAELSSLRYDTVEADVTAHPSSIFLVDQHLWETFADGRVCQADPGFVHCYIPSPTESDAHWHSVVAGGNGLILARSDEVLATIDPTTGSIRTERLPDQGGAYEGYGHVLGLFRSPRGELVTQSAHGLIVRRDGEWVELGEAAGVPAGTITSIVVDASNQLWLQVYGRGLFRGLNYGHWESLKQEDGLSQGSAWATARAGASLWVATDTGVDELDRVNGVWRVVRTFPNVSYTVVSGPYGTIWSSAGKQDVLVLTPATGKLVRLPLPILNAAVVSAGSRVWLGTARGLFHVDVSPGRPLKPIPDSIGGTVEQLTSDGAEGIWVVEQGHVWHVYRDGHRVPLSGRWTTGEFRSYAIAHAPDGHLWIGGAGGLYDLTVVDDTVVHTTSIPATDIRTNAVVSVMIDHRGWVWAGTGQGVSVFNGHRWVSTDSDMGLVWDDVSQGGLFADPDGSVWISTSLGVSHLLDPDWLFADRPIRVAISQATLGQASLQPGTLPYTDAPLSLQFGTLSFGSERSIVFRYKLSGVDQNWDQSTTGSVRYPSIPPGRHVLTLVGYDPLSHVVSAPVTLVIKMSLPWWRNPWAYLLYFALGSLTLYGFLRVRDRAAVAAKRKLEALVEERTRGLQLAEAELKHQASVDSLTGLLNRREVRRRLQDRLGAADGRGDTLVAMLDVDHFKRVNDGHGHLVGDDLLCAIGVRLSAMLRDGECAGRFGGEEFILILDDRDGRGAERILVLHQMIRQNPFHLPTTSIAVTCSIGLSWAGPGDDWTSLIGRADTALYEAKSGGRDRIVESHDDLALISPPRRPGLV